MRFAQVLCFFYSQRRGIALAMRLATLGSSGLGGWGVGGVGRVGGGGGKGRITTILFCVCVCGSLGAELGQFCLARSSFLSSFEC